MKKIKFITATPDPEGNLHLNTTDGNEAGLKKEIAKVKKGISKPIDPATVTSDDSFWKSKAKIVTEGYPFSRACRYQNPESLWEAAKEYFVWSDNTPMLEGKRSETDKATGFESREDFAKKKHVYTLISFLNYAGISNWQWYENYKKHPAFSDVIETVERTIYDNKYKGAVSGFYNATIISRDLGLEEKTRAVNEKEEGNVMTIDIDKLDDKELDSFLDTLHKYVKTKTKDVIDV